MHGASAQLQPTVRMSYQPHPVPLLDFARASIAIGPRQLLLPQRLFVSPSSLHAFIIFEKEILSEASYRLAQTIRGLP